MTTSPVVSVTDELIAELERLASKATPGSWKWDGREVDEEGYVYIPECSYLVGSICLASDYEGYQDDCDFMAAASPATILALLAERAELKRDAERYRFWRYMATHEPAKMARTLAYYETSEQLDVAIDAAMQS